MDVTQTVKGITETVLTTDDASTITVTDNTVDNTFRMAVEDDDQDTTLVELTKKERQTLAQLFCSDYHPETDDRPTNCVAKFYYCRAGHEGSRVGQFVRLQSQHLDIIESGKFKRFRLDYARNLTICKE